jgi:competence protein ComEC
VSVALPTRTKLRLLPVCAATWAAALGTTLVPAAAGIVAALLWASALGVLLACARSRRGPERARPRGRTAAVVVLALAASAAATSHVAVAQPARAVAVDFALGGGRAVSFTATVTGKIEHRPSGEWVFDAVTERVTTGDTTAPARLDITIRVRPDEVDRPDRLDVGAAVEVHGTARAALPGDRAVLTVRASRGLVVTAEPAGMLAVAAQLRRGLLAATVGLPHPGAGLIPGLAVGDTSGVGAELDTAMKASSLSHLTAVSGANCAIVVGLAFGAVAALGGSRRARVAAGLIALAGFVLLVTPEPSVVRAGAMAAIAMIGVLLGRSGAGMALLCLAVTVLLVADPWLAGALGFALSAVATGSLLMFARPLADGLTRRMPRPLALALSVPLAAQLACGPLLVSIAPAVPLYGVIANLLAAPAAPVATVVGLAACLSAPVPWLQSGLTAVAWLPAAWIAGTAQTISSLPGDQVAWPEGPGGVAALAVVGLAFGIVVAAPRTRLRVVRIGAGLLVAVVVGIVVGGAALASIAGRWTLPAPWSVLACDVGQGDAVLVRSAEVIALIDTGPEPEPLERCLARAGIDRIDLLVLTHFDADHVGGSEALSGRVGTVLHGPIGSAEDERVLAGFAEGGARVVRVHAGTRGDLGSATWRVLWPPAQSRAFAAGNDASVVMDIRGGGVPSALYLGDLSASPQAALAASGTLDPPYDLVKVAHHGSADQDARLYALADPAAALVTVGADNTYGHPRAEILRALEGIGAVVARTDAEGVIALWRTERGVHVWRERAGDVAPAG